MKPIVYYWACSPPARNVMMVIRHLNLDIDIQEQDYNVIQDPTYAKKNPDRKIPLYEEDGFCLAESIAICQYLIESKAPERAGELLGKTPKERAIINHRLFFEVGTLYQKLYNAVIRLYSGEINKLDEGHKEECCKSLAILDTLLSEYPFAAGDHVTLADLVILPMVSNYKGLKLDMSKYPTINSWYERCRPVVPGFEENEQGGKDYHALLSNFMQEPFF